MEVNYEISNPPDSADLVVIGLLKLVENQYDRQGW
jgi:hypothetical protein